MTSIISHDDLAALVDLAPAGSAPGGISLSLYVYIYIYITTTTTTNNNYNNNHNELACGRFTRTARIRAMNPQCEKLDRSIGITT